MKGIEHRFSQSRRAKGLPDGRMREQIDRAACAQRWESLTANADGLALVDDGDGASDGGVGDRGGLAVIEGLGGRADDKLLEVLCAGPVEGDEIEEAGRHEVVEQIRIPTAGGATVCQFTGDDIDNCNAMGQGGDDGRGAPGGVEINDGAGVGHKGAGIIHAGQG
jgi:hypothetical protein